MDDCKIDLVHLPLNIQCKSGYNDIGKAKADVRAKYEKAYQETKELMNEHLMDDDPVQNRPYILIQKLNTTKKKAPEYFQVTMTYEFFLRLIELAHDRL